MHVICPARCRVGEGLLAEHSVDVKEPEERRRLKLTHAWLLRTMTDKSRLLTDSSYKSRTVIEFASGKSMHTDRHSSAREIHLITSV